MKQVPKPVFFLFNVTFISFIQSFLLFAISAAPAYNILLSTRFEPQITAADWMYFYIILGLVLSEWISDGQQWGTLSLPTLANLCNANIIQTTTRPSTPTSRRPRSPRAGFRRSLIVVSSLAECGHTADIPTSSLSRPSGLSFTSGAASPPTPYTVGPARAPLL